MTTTIAPRPEPAAKGPGRPRSQRAHQSILHATIELLLEQGFAEMSVEGVARRAGAGKATIYRRWPSKADLVAEAVGNLSHKVLRPVDTGNVRDDLVDLGRQVFHTKEAGEVTTIMLKLMSERARHPDLQAAFMRRVVEPRRRVVTEVLERGVTRGELRSDVDVDLLTDVLSGVISYRVMVGAGQHALQPDTLERVIDMILEGVAARPAGRSGRRRARSPQTRSP
jgi:AcrR family transcriptional regulator